MIRLYFIYLQVKIINWTLGSRVDGLIRGKIHMGLIQKEADVIYYHDCADTALRWKLMKSNIEQGIMRTVQKGWIVRI